MNRIQITRHDSLSNPYSAGPSLLRPHHDIQSPMRSSEMGDTQKQVIFIKLRQILTTTRKMRHQLSNMKKMVSEGFLTVSKSVGLTDLPSKSATPATKVVSSTKESKPVQTNPTEDTDKENTRARLNHNIINNNKLPETLLTIQTAGKPIRQQDLPKKVQSSVPVPATLTKVEIQKPLAVEGVKKIGPVTAPCQTENLRNNIYKQLEELRNLEKREHIVRNLNDSRVARHSVSEVKRPSHPTRILQNKKPESLSKSFESKSVCASDTKPSTMTFETEYSGDVEDKNMDLINIDVAIQKPTSSKIILNTNLHCPAKHEYYTGGVCEGAPHGYGRLFNCCSKMPMAVPEEFEFYSGHFSFGKFEGYGTLTLKQGMKYVGMFKEGKKHGEGSLYYKGKVEVARWHNDRFVDNL